MCVTWKMGDEVVLWMRYATLIISIYLFTMLIYGARSGLPSAITVYNNLQYIQWWRMHNGWTISPELLLNLNPCFKLILLLLDAERSFIIRVDKILADYNILETMRSLYDHT